MNRWNGCVALVTGASRGIGAAISNRLLDHGINVVGCATNLQNVEKLVQTKDVASSRGKFHPVKCDVSQEHEVLSMFDEIKRKFDRIHICINNAGIIEKAPLMSGNVRDWRRVMEVNVLGTCLTTREALKLMKEKKVDDGVIVHMVGIGGHKIASIPTGSPDPGVGIYNGTKFMVRALAESLRQELKSHDSRIRVSTISPGPVKTAMLGTVKGSEVFDSAMYLNTADVAEAVVYVLNNDAHVNVDDVIVQSVHFRV